MITEKDKNLLTSLLVGNVPTLFLGAGFSIGSKSETATMDGLGLKDYILESLVKGKVEDTDYEEILGYNLRELCDEVISIYGGNKELYELLTRCFKNTVPSGNCFHEKLLSYPWEKIYTVNVDDLVENIYKRGERDLFVQNKTALKEEPQDKPVLYKLHGCVNNPRDGYIFAEQEYTDLISKKVDAKMLGFTEDLLNTNVIFVGAKMDEPDIKYYLSVLQNAGIKVRSNRITFIDPYPDRKLSRIANLLNASVIEATTEEFLDYVYELNYHPEEINKAIYKMNYNGVHRLVDIEKNCFVIPYESKIYYGNVSNWQDAANKWIIETTSYTKALIKLNTILSSNAPVSCFGLYGALFSGKSCILKNIGYYLRSQSYDVLEHTGKRLDVDSIWRYIKVSPNKLFAIVIDGGSFYYEQIEKMFFAPIEGKKIVVISASREYYHKKKRYYLEGNPFEDFEVKSSFSKDDINTVLSKLDEKSHLSFLASKDERERAKYVRQCGNIINLIIGLTYGNVANRIKNEYERMLPRLTDDEQKLLLELAIFDIADIEYYPRLLFAERFGKRINLETERAVDHLGIVDFARTDMRGVSLRNAMLNSLIIKNNQNKIAAAIIEILQHVSKYVVERNNDIWYFIFQCLLKEDILAKRFNLSIDEVEKIFLSLKDEYRGISYYWLQLGLLFQRKNDYTSAYVYLEQSASIRPNSYKIQHALARNYLRDANNTSDYEKARLLFEQGEAKMKELIDSSDYYKQKAKPFSVTCYVAEKIKFHNQFAVRPSKKDLRYMVYSLESVQEHIDSYMESIFEKFYFFLKEYGELNELHLALNSPFMKYIGSDKPFSNLSVDEIEFE